jgi:uncharacterized HAD superfamily protein
MKIGVDLDDVLADLLNKLVKFHNEKFGTSLTRKDFNNYNLWKVWGGTKEETVQKLYDFYNSDYSKKVGVIDGAKESVNSLKKNHKLVVITSRQNDFIEQTERWVNENFPGVFSGIYFTNYQSRSGKIRTKSEICDKLGIDILIEDSLKFAKDCARPDRKVFLLDRPWNQSSDLPENLTRVFSWKEILNQIKGIEN